MQWHLQMAALCACSLPRARVPGAHQCTCQSSRPCPSGRCTAAGRGDGQAGGQTGSAVMGWPAGSSMHTARLPTLLTVLWSKESVLTLHRRLYGSQTELVAVQLAGNTGGGEAVVMMACGVGGWDWWALEANRCRHATIQATIQATKSSPYLVGGIAGGAANSHSLQSSRGTAATALRCPPA